VREDGLFKLLPDLVALVHSSGRLEEPSFFEEAHAWRDVMEIGSKPIVVSVINSKLVADRSVIEYKGMVVVLSDRGS
jgi:hypothetical protein